MGAFTTLAILGGVAAVGKAYGSIKAGDAAARAGVAERESAESAAGLFDYNAAVADLQASDAIARGAEEENRFRAGVRGIVGAQRAGFAAGNVDVGFGSALDVQADAAYLGELDALTIRTNAAREAWGYKVEAEDLRRRGQITRKEGKNAELAGREQRLQSRIGAASTILGTAGSLVGQKYGFG